MSAISPPKPLNRFRWNLVLGFPRFFPVITVLEGCRRYVPANRRDQPNLWRSTLPLKNRIMIHIASNPHNRGRLHSVYNSDYPTLSSNRANLTLLCTISYHLYRFHISSTPSYCNMLTHRRPVNSPSLSLSPIFLNFNPLQTKRRPLYLKTQSVPLCKHFSSRL